MAFSDVHLFFDDLQIGQEWQTGGRTITEADIVNFAGISGDFNPIHLDHEFAKQTPFRRPFAHGLLLLAVASGLSINLPPVRTMAFLSIKEWNFFAPVFIGDTVHASSKVLAKEEKARGRRGIITWQRRILNQENKLVQEGITLTMVEGRANLERQVARENARSNS